MHEFHGHLLIGGMTLKDLDGQLEEEAPQGESSEWRLAGCGCGCAHCAFRYGEVLIPFHAV